MDVTWWGLSLSLAFSWLLKMVRLVAACIRSVMRLRYLWAFGFLLCFCSGRSDCCLAFAMGNGCHIFHCTDEMGGIVTELDP